MFKNVQWSRGTRQTDRPIPAKRVLACIAMKRTDELVYQCSATVKLTVASKMSCAVIFLRCCTLMKANKH